jgi:hypothetical protein
MGRQESGFRIRDTLRNTGTEAKPLSLRLGAGSHAQAEPWCLSRCCWFGDEQQHSAKFTPSSAGSPATLEARSPRLFWRVIGQYGVGFLYQTTAPLAPVQLTHELPKEKGCPADFQWLASPVPLAAGKTLVVDSAVLIDEGGRQGNNPSALASCDRLVVTADLCAAGKSGEPLRGFGSVVSAVPRRVKMVVSQSPQAADLEKGRVKVAEFDLTLEPGKTAFRPLELPPTRAGLVWQEIAILDEKGGKLAVSADRSVIDGEGRSGEAGAIWKKYSTRLPEVHARGNWQEIGEQLVKSGNPGPFKPRDTAGADAANLLAFYQKQFPFYAEFLKGAARGLQVTPEKLVAVDAGSAGLGEACMGVFFNGPDGPLNAFSKERSGTSLNGLGYVKVLPDKGYPYHMYTLGNWSFGYGINAAGLCTSGATINCDDRTDAAGVKATREWKQAGKTVAPLGTHLMLATCKNVDEALAFIENPQAPFEFTGNMLLVDRAGNAAVLESVGIFHQIRRPAGQVFATGNYPHERADGLFRCGPNWGWGANTMLREQFLGRILAERQGQISLKDAFWIMETHAVPSGMCQHIVENPGSLYSSTSYLAVTRTGELHISAGPPCQVRYQRYTLKDE